MSKFEPKEHLLTDEDFEKIRYTNLKNHTGYTLQMGFGTTKEHLKMCAKKGHQGCAFTDKGVMMGALDLYNQAQDKKLLESMGYEGKSFPIIMGASLFLTEDTHIKNKAQKYYTISLYAKNQAGYENLCYLTSIASQDEKFYVRPRIDLFDLFENKEGIVCASGGFSGMIGQAILEEKGKFRNHLYKLLNDRERLEEVKDFLEKFKDVNAPDKVSKLIEVMQVDDEVAEEYWRKWLVESSFWHMFPKLLNSPELLQLIRDTEDKFPLDRVDFALVDSMPWEEDEKGAMFNVLTDVDVEVVVQKFKEEFKDDFYFEMSIADARWRWVKDLKQHEDIGYNPQDIINQRLVTLSEKYGIKCVLVQDSHMPDAEQHLLQSIMIWNSPSGKDGWSFYEALEIMDIPTMYYKTNDKYPWISDEQFIEWCNNTDEVLKKCKDCKLNFEPSLPTLDYEGHYVNRVPVVIRRSLMIELQERKLWSEELKSKLMEFQSFESIEGIPDDIKAQYDTKEKIIDFEDMENRKQENVFLEEVLIKMKSFYKKEKEFVKMLERSENDLALRTALKVMIRNKKLLPKIIDQEKLDKIIAERAPGKTSKDFKPEVVQNVISKYNLFRTADDPMLLLGEKVQRDRIVEEVTTIQYNGIIKLMSYFMLLEDVSNFIAENGYLRGFGRGCLTGDALVQTASRGLVPLKDVKEGDEVFTHKGNPKKVIKTFKYDVDEELLEIHTSNSNGTIKLTADHKVYGVKTVETQRYRNNAHQDKVRRYEEIVHEPGFFPAAELKEGDLLFVKKPNYHKKHFKDVDLAQFMQASNAEVTTDKIMVFNPLTKNLATTHARYLPMNEEFFYILGKWVGDGCVAYNEEARKYVVTFAFNKNEKEEISLVKDFFSNLGFSVGQYDAKDKSLSTLEVYSKALASWFKSSFPEYKNTSRTKYIGEFKYVEEKLLKSLIKGLLSADGHTGPEQGANRGEAFDTTSPKLRDEVREICLYLGIPTSVQTREPYMRGEYLCRESYKIKFTGINLDVKKTQNKIYEDGYYVKVKSINKAAAEPVYDLMIADEPSYLTSNFTVHNSGAGSIVAYALDITDCDPLEYNLLFERFLTTERIGEVFYEIEGVPLKEFLSKEEKVSTIQVSSEDLKLDDEELIGEAEINEDGSGENE